MKSSIQQTAHLIQQAFGSHPDLQSVRRVGSLESLEVTTVNDGGIKGIQLIKLPGTGRNGGTHGAV
jgi:hypothetical protein